MSRCSSYWFMGDATCGLIAGHENHGQDHHVGVPNGPRPARYLFRWRSQHPRAPRDFAGLTQTHRP